MKPVVKIKAFFLKETFLNMFHKKDEDITNHLTGHYRILDDLTE
jgi:hypothetical protein